MIDELTDDRLRVKALDVLTEQLGASQTFRFLSWLRGQPRDYQAWRDAHFQGLSADDLIGQMRELETRQSVASPDVAAAASQLIRAMEGAPEAAVLVGTILVVKTRGEGGGSRLMVRTLAPEQLAAIKQRPELLEPARLLAFLGSDSTKGDGSAGGS
jgi:hypothetical protein